MSFFSFGRLFSNDKSKKDPAKEQGPSPVRYRPALEELDQRIAPAVFFWDGRFDQDYGLGLQGQPTAGFDPSQNWSYDYNWVGDVSPGRVPGSHTLIFGSGNATAGTVNNDFPDLTVMSAIYFQ